MRRACWLHVYHLKEGAVRAKLFVHSSTVVYTHQNGGDMLQEPWAENQLWCNYQITQQGRAGLNFVMCVPRLYFDIPTPWHKLLTVSDFVCCMSQLNYYYYYCNVESPTSKLAVQRARNKPT